VNLELIVDQEFREANYQSNRLSKAEYEDCLFEGCNFSGGFLDNTNFLNCEFIDCNLSNVNVKYTVFKEVRFIRCKMMGLKFEDCNAIFLSFSLSHCNLSYASFHKVTLKNAYFVECIFDEADFTKADFTKTVFDQCNMKNVVFEGTNLESADMATSFNLKIDPERNRIKKARFSKDQLGGLLEKYDIVIT